MEGGRARPRRRPALKFYFNTLQHRQTDHDEVWRRRKGDGRPFSGGLRGRLLAREPAAARGKRDSSLTFLAREGRPPGGRLGERGGGRRSGRAWGSVGLPTHRMAGHPFPTPTTSGVPTDRRVTTGVRTGLSLCATKRVVSPLP